jgi:hypothetical protein
MGPTRSVPGPGVHRPTTCAAGPAAAGSAGTAVTTVATDDGYGPAEVVGVARRTSSASVASTGTDGAGTALTTRRRRHRGEADDGCATTGTARPAGTGGSATGTRRPPDIAAEEPDRTGRHGVAPNNDDKTLNPYLAVTSVTVAGSSRTPPPDPAPPS